MIVAATLRQAEANGDHVIESWRAEPGLVGIRAEDELVYASLQRACLFERPTAVGVRDTLGQNHPPVHAQNPAQRKSQPSGRLTPSRVEHMQAEAQAAAGRRSQRGLAADPRLRGEIVVDQGIQAKARDLHHLGERYLPLGLRRRVEPTGEDGQNGCARSRAAL